MKAILLSVACLILAISSLAAPKTSLADISRALAVMDSVTIHADYEILLPSVPDPVTYDINAICLPAHGDTLALCRYLIDWILPRPSGQSHGFAAYFDGNHYRQRDLKLQEYHVVEDPTPFIMGRGVQNQAQFVELLPIQIGVTLDRIASDTVYTYTISENDREIRVTGTQRVQGYDAQNFAYTFDAATKYPIKLSIDYNPASISEQNLDVRFTISEVPPGTQINDEALIDRYPDEFAKYRTSNFGVASLVGNPLPGYQVTAPTRERVVYNRHDCLSAPAVFTFLDPSVAGTEDVISLLANVATTIPRSTDFYIVFSSSPSAKVLEAIQPGIFAGVYSGAVSFARDCGVTAYPTLLFVNTDGIVKDYQTGANQNLQSIVIQKSMMCY